MDHHHDASGIPSDSAEGTFRRAVRAFGSQRSQQVQIRVYAVALFSLGVLLTFNSSVFNFVAQFTDRPEILPSALLIPYVYLVFQVVLWQLDRDEESELEAIRYAERRRDVPERVLERKSAVSSFDRGMSTVPSISAEGFASQISHWIAERSAAETLEVMMLSYSSETLLSGCLASAREIRTKLASDPELKPPMEIQFRLLARDLNAQWRIPFIYEQKADALYRTKLSGRFSQHLARWDEELPDAFGDILYRHQLSLEVRLYPFEPLLKGAVVRSRGGSDLLGDVGLIGIYGTHSVRESGVEGVDYHGWGSVMHRISTLAEASPVEQTALHDFVEYFEEIWAKHSRVDDSF